MERNDEQPRHTRPPATPEMVAVAEEFNRRVAALGEKLQPILFRERVREARRREAQK